MVGYEPQIISKVAQSSYDSDKRMRDGDWRDVSTVRALSAFPKVLSSFPNNQKWLTTIYNEI